MRYIVRSALLAVVFNIVLFAPQAEASDFGSGMASMASLAAMSSDGHMASGGGDLRAFFDWLKHILTKFFGAGAGGGGGGGGYTGNPTPKGSVAIPGTLVLFGGGFAALMIWRAGWPRP